MLKIGITGGIGSGKTTVCRLFAALGVPVYEADTRARWVMEHDPVLREQLVDAFGSGVFDAAGHLDRPGLAAAVFDNVPALARLNGLVHPAVGADFAAWVAAQRATGAAYVLKEAALMFESDAWKQLDAVVAVAAPEALRVARVLRRDPQRSAEQVAAIIARQLPEDERVARAQYVLINDDYTPLLAQVLALHGRLETAAAGTQTA